MQSKLAFMGGLVAAAVLAVACSTTTSSVATSPSAPGSMTTIGVADNAKLGKILVDGGGKTVYLFEADKGAASTCYGDCATYWPPVLTTGAPDAGTGVNASLLGTTSRKDGAKQVTYAGHPLYYVVTDHQAGDTTGQRVNNFGAPWDVVGPDGMQIG